MKIYGLLGHPLSHSFSKKFFDEKFDKENILNTQFKLFDLETINELPKLIEQEMNLKGFAITIPYKEQILSYLNKVDETVQQIKACNCVKIINGALHGFNTDVIGFEKMLLPLLKPHHTKALILGTGGAAKAVAFVLKKMNIEFTYVSRKVAENQLSYEQLTEEIIKLNPLIINCSPLGTYPNIESFPAIPYEYISTQHLLVDLVYNPPQTAFMQKGLSKGAVVCNGYQMLVLQAEENWKIWNTDM